MCVATKPATRAPASGRCVTIDRHVVTRSVLMLVCMCRPPSEGTWPETPVTLPSPSPPRRDARGGHRTSSVVGVTQQFSDGLAKDGARVPGRGIDAEIGRPVQVALGHPQLRQARGRADGLPEVEEP